MTSLKISILGTRGVPAAYGGFETFAEELGARLVQRGHDVTVYGRRAFFSRSSGEPVYRGMKRRIVPTVMHKYLETPLHALTSFIDLFFQRCDVVLLCNAANSPFAFLVKLRGVPLAINVDGIERMRSKWNRLGKLWYLLGERCSVLFANTIVADAKVIGDYYKERFSVQPTVIAYGATASARSPGATSEKFSLSPRKYLLYVSRFEPENNALGVVQAYAKIPESERTMPLVMVGDAPYADRYKELVHQSAVPGVIFTGFQFGEAYQELRSHCYAAIQATEVGGTHPALIEAMAYGNAVVANDVPEHREVLADTGLYYGRNDFDALALRMRELLGSSELAAELGRNAAMRATELYCWERVTDQYEALFSSLCRTEIERASTVEAI